MYVIRPITLTDSILTSSNVPETDYPAWNVATAYTAGNKCIVASIITILTEDNNIIITESGNSLVMESSATSVHKIYEALVNVTGGSSPEVDVLAAVPKWLEVGATNRWQAFDGKVGSQTSQANSITYKITPGEYFDSIAFLGLDAITVQVTITDPVYGVVYDQTKDLQTTVITGSAVVTDWYTYFFSSIIRLTDFVFLDLYLYLNAVLDITITYTGGTAKVGGIVFGLQTNLGITAANPKPTFGTTDYSTKTQDQWGNWSVVKRSNSKRMTCTLIVDNLAIDEIERLLAFYLSTLLVWIGDVNYGSMIVYGYCKDHITNAGYKNSDLTIEIEGLS